MTEPLHRYRAGMLFVRALWVWGAIAMLAAIAAAQPSPEVFPLERDRPAEREIAGGQKHRYRLALAAGQFLRVEVEQQGVDLGLAILDPAGTRLSSVNEEEKQVGREELAVIATTDGEYLLDIVPVDARAPAGRYRAIIAEQAAAGPRERDYLAAQQLVIEAGQLLTKQRAETHREALAKFEAALALWRKLGRKKHEADALGSLGNTAYNLGDRRRALGYFEQRLPLTREIGDKINEAVTLNNLGLVNYNLGNLPQAIEAYEQALPIRRAVGDRRGEGATLHNLALLFETLGDFQKAAQYHEWALPLRRASGDRTGEAFSLQGLGLQRYRSGKYRESLDYLEQAYAIRRELGDARGQAISLLSLGTVWRMQGDMQKALDHFNRALEIIRPTGYKPTETTALLDLGEAYRLLGDRRQAREYFLRALPLARATGDRGQEAQALHDLGRLSDDNPQQGVEYLRQALEILRAIGRQPLQEAAVLSLLGAKYRAMGRHREALEVTEQSLALVRANGNPRSQEAAALNNLAVTWFALREPQRSAELHREAVAAARASGYKEIEIRSLTSIAFHERDTGELAQALADAETVVERVESLRETIASPALRASFLGNFQEAHLLLAQVLMRLDAKEPGRGHGARALQAAERARARSLVEMLREARIDVRQGADAALLDEERRLQTQINVRANELEKLQGNRQQENRRAQLDGELRTLAAELEQVRARMRSQSPRYAALMQPEPLSVAQIQRELLDADTMLLEYGYTEGEACLWAVTRDAITSHRLPPSAEVDAAARRLYDLLNVRQRVASLPEPRREREIAEAEAKFPAEASALSRMLLGPVAGQLGRRRLVIVAPGALQQIPFSALPLPTEAASAAYRPLLVEHEVVHLPSAAALAMVRRETAGRTPAPRAIVVMADPVFEANDPRVQVRLAGGAARPGAAATRAEGPPTELERAVDAMSGARASLVRLPHTRREAEAIMALAPASAGMKALDFQADRGLAVNGELSRYRIVHFATHALLNSAQPDLSGLVFSLVDEEGKPRDGFLRLHEIYNMRLPADLVVLSACQTALGQEIKGEGLIGLARGMMYAGAQRVVASLWQVNDAATADLMKRFYQGMLRDGRRPAAALRDAQLEMWRRRPTQAPYYWAAFVLQGEWK